LTEFLTSTCIRFMQSLQASVDGVGDVDSFRRLHITEKDSAIAASVASQLTLKLAQPVQMYDIGRLFEHARLVASPDDVYLIKAGELVATLKRAEDRLATKQVTFSRGDLISVEAMRSFADSRVDVKLGTSYLTCVMLPPSVVPTLPLAFRTQLEHQYARKVFSAVDAFLGFSDDDIDTLIAAGTPMEFKAGEVRHPIASLTPLDAAARQRASA
jgi:hypothetical protein